MDVRTGSSLRYGAAGGDVIGGRPVPPDGARFFSASDSAAAVLVTDVASGRTVEARGIRPDEMPSSWTPDSRGLFVYVRRSLPCPIDIVDPVTGSRKPWRTLSPVNPNGIIAPVLVSIAADGRTITYDFTRQQSDMIVIDGLR